MHEMMFKTLLKPRTALILMFLILFAMAFFFDDASTIYHGYIAILKSPSILISDYLEIGGLGATLFNVATILLINVIMISFLKTKMSGPVFAGILTIAGFSFFGKNIFNTIPIYVGIYLYARLQKLDFKSFLIVVLFSTGISPVVSFMIFGIDWSGWFRLAPFWNYWIGIPAGVLVGIFTGFVLPALSAHTIRFHKGYNLYNIGFAMGILSMLFSALFRSFRAIDLDQGGPTSEAYHAELMVLTIVLSLIFIAIAYINDPRVHKKYIGLMKSSGRLVSDFIRDYGRSVSMLNVGIMGLLCALVLWLLGFEINGPMMGAILTVMGFGAFGKHPRNCLPVMLGAYLAVVLTDYTFDGIGMMIAILFVTAASPIAGRYGVLIGILAGFIHVAITPLALVFQEGGFNLYNNGFAAGFVAALMVPFLEALTKKNNEEEEE